MRENLQMGAYIRDDKAEEMKFVEGAGRARCIIAWDSFPSAILPSGISTKQAIPARAAYAAAAAEVLPVEAQMMARAPASTALVTAIVMPRSLKEPVGFSPSNLARIRTFFLIFFGRLTSSISGVLPSLRLITGVSAADRETVAVTIDEAGVVSCHGHVKLFEPPRAPGNSQATS